MANDEDSKVAVETNDWVERSIVQACKAHPTIGPAVQVVSRELLLGTLSEKQLTKAELLALAKVLIAANKHSAPAEGADE